MNSDEPENSIDNALIIGSSAIAKSNREAIFNPDYAVGFVMRMQSAINQKFMFEKHSTAMVKKIN